MASRTIALVLRIDKLLSNGADSKSPTDSVSWVRRKGQVMPDPLLTRRNLDKEIEEAKKVAQHFKASISSQDRFVFLETTDNTGRKMLARIDCDGYPEQPLNAEFLDPETGARVDAIASNKSEHWPKSPAPIARDNNFYLCLAGTRSYLKVHTDPGYVLPLTDLVKSLILWCRGRSNLLRTAPPRKVPLRRVPRR